jgi:hypothetical protein
VGLAVGLGVRVGVGCGVDVGSGVLQPAMPEAIARSNSTSATRSESVKLRLDINPSQCTRFPIAKLGKSITHGRTKVNPAHSFT